MIHACIVATAVGNEHETKQHWTVSYVGKSNQYPYSLSNDAWQAITIFRILLSDFIHNYVSVWICQPSCTEGNLGILGSIVGKESPSYHS